MFDARICPHGSRDSSRVQKKKHQVPAKISKAQKSTSEETEGFQKVI